MKDTYTSFEQKTKNQANIYIATHSAPHRFLAYRDVSKFISKYVTGLKALDYGCGTGFSSKFLSQLDFDVIGIDISAEMLQEAKLQFPNINFCSVKSFKSKPIFNLIFSSFVLFELSSKSSITTYLKNVYNLLSENGIFIGITGSEKLYSVKHNWMSFKTNFPENRNLSSGKVVKLLLNHGNVIFYDFYWTTQDYIECFKKANLEILEIYHPLGKKNEVFPWKDELLHSPFSIFIARKKI